MGYGWGLSHMFTGLGKGYTCVVHTYTELSQIVGGVSLLHHLRVVSVVEV